MYDGHTSIKKGIFVPIDADIDGFALLQVQCSSLVYSYGTALYVWGLTDIIPHTFHISVPQGENISRLVRDNQKIKAHYVMKGFYNLGITETQSPQGAVIRLHDKERCLCDLIKDRSQIEKQLYVQAIRDYFKSQPDIRKLLKYGKAFGIKKQLCGDFFLPGNRYAGNMQDRYGRIIFAGRDRHT